MTSVNREAILDKIGAGLSRAKAAKILGLSRQYVGQLVKNRKAKMNVPPAAPSPAPSLAPSPSAPTIPELPPTAAPEVPAENTAGAPSLAQILEEANAPPPGAPLPPPPPIPAAVPLAYDPEDAAAGAELLEMGRGGLAAYVGTRIFGLKADDPRLDALREPNKFLARALKRNESKTALLGSLTGGLLGLGIGYAAEIGRAILHFAGLGLEPLAQPSKDVPPPPAAAPGADDDDDDEPPAGGFSISAAKAAAERRSQ